LQDRYYDLVVVGGGIHGVGVAQEASAMGHSVLLIEKKEIASGTSGASSKLIHGGLRYLERMELSLVRECLTERAALLRLAPDLVKLKPFHIPVFKGKGRPSWQIWAGLTLYSALSGFSKDNSFGTIPRAEWPDMDGLRTDGLKKIYRYYDAQTDDALLTKAVMDSAQRLGAELATPAILSSAELTGNGVKVTYTEGKNEKTCEAKVLVNAAGPWANPTLGLVRPIVRGLDMDLVQGTHIIVEGKLEKGMYFLEAPQDKRMVFALQWKGNTMVGTTETLFTRYPDEVVPLDEEIEYLKEVLVYYFPRFRESVEKGLLSSFAGLRVLPVDDKSHFRKSRETILHPDRKKNPRVLTIYGGKLTAYRATARKVMKRLESSLPKRRAVADSSTLMLKQT
jgi:glycerol-3-phosphate dehydrogenase